MRMGSSKITSKFQVTLPADVRAKVDVRPGETVEIVAQDDRTLVLRLRRKVKDPLKYLIGKRPLLKRHIPPDELDELMEP